MSIHMTNQTDKTLTSFTTEELRNILTPIHSRIDHVLEVLSDDNHKGNINAIDAQIHRLNKCDKALTEFYELMKQRELDNQQGE